MKDMEIKEGDIFALGQHKLTCGSSSDSILLQKLLRDEKIRLALSDPPYGVSYVESKNGFKQDLACPINIANDNISSDSDYLSFSIAWIQAIIPHLESKNIFYIFNSDKMIFPLKEAMEESGVKLSQLLIWVKSHAVVGRLDYLPQHELIAYGWHGTHLFRKSKAKSVLFYPKPNKSKLHPTMKPISLLRELILNSSNMNEIVFDGFGGSGSTLIACEHLSRKCRMVELDPIHCATIIKRWEKVTGKTAKKL